MRISAFHANWMTPVSAAMCLCLCLCLLLLPALSSEAAAQQVQQAAITPDSLTDEHVQQAVAAIVEELYARKHPERMWEPAQVPAGESKRQGGGYTALVTLAMLHAGQSYQEPRLRDAIEYLAACDMQGTYAVAVRACVWAKLPAQFLPNLEADVKWLLEGFSTKSAGWDYVQNANTNYQDNSIRQFGALALWEASRRGMKIDPRLWRQLEQAFIDAQLPDGGWNYRGEGPATGSMTAAGLATLFITQAVLHANDMARLSAAATDSRHQRSLERGLQWMQHRFTPADNPGQSSRHFYYYLYGVERVGLASGYKYFGDRDWFRQGAAELLNRLCQWDEASRTFTVHQKIGGRSNAASIRTDDLAFALLFLSRGRVPVAINKLQFDGKWNNRPRDAANLTSWIRDQTETDLNWQIVSMNDEPETWLDAPLLYLASSEPLPWVRDLGIDGPRFVRDAREFIRRRAAGELPEDVSPPQRPDVPELHKLRRYLDAGGMLFAVAEGAGARNVASSLELAGQLMYPQYQWRTLPADHPVFTIHTQITGQRPPMLRGLSNGVRELIIIAPAGDFAQHYQRADARTTMPFDLGMNVYLYASELNRPRPRLAQHAIDDVRSIAPSDAPTATIVRALHEGNWKPEPQALNVFASWLAKQRSINVRIVDHPLSLIHELDPQPDLVIVSGIDAHSFSSQQIDAINRHVQAGGMILFETPGGCGAFTQSAEQMALELFGQPIESLHHHPLLTAEHIDGARDLTRVEYRPYSMEHFGSRETVPRLRGMLMDDGKHPRVLFSREDISNALLNQPRWGISGYAPQSARDLLENIVQYAMQLRKAASP